LGSIRAAAQEAVYAQQEAKDGDTLPRVRLRPVGRAVASVLGAIDGQLDDLYDPESVARSFYHPTEDIARHAFVPTRVGTSYLDPPSPHRLQMVEMRREGGRWVHQLKQQWVKSGKALEELTESAPYRRSRFLEATGMWQPGGIDSANYRRCVESHRGAVAEYLKKLKEAGVTHGDGGFAFGSYGNEGAGVMANIDAQYFVPILGGPYYRQLYLYAHWEQTAKAFEMKNHSELARAAIEITTDFSLGRGFIWKIRNPRVSAIWREFWDRNGLELGIRTLCDDLTWQGELMIRKFQNLRGYLEIRSMDPGSFYEIVTDPTDIKTVFFYSAQFPTQWQLPYTQTQSGRNLNIPLSQYVIQQYPATEILHIKQNVSSTEKWGRSDFYASLSTLKRHRDWTNASTLKDMLQANLVWKIKVHGDDSDVQAFLNDPTNSQLPAFGGTWIENDALTLDALHEDVSQGGGRLGQGSVGQFLTALFAAGQQMPLAFFNMTGTGSARATALVQGEPFVKKIATRQQVLQVMLDSIYQEVMRVAVDAGRIPAALLRGEDADPEWIWPSLYEEDRGGTFRDLTQAESNRSLSHYSVSLRMAQELGFDEYDYDEEQSRIRREQADPLTQFPLPPAVAAATGTAGGASTPPQSEAPPAGPHEQLKGVDARSDFRQQQGEHPQGGA
jgi:hypothetical protein